MAFLISTSLPWFRRYSHFIYFSRLFDFLSVILIFKIVSFNFLDDFLISQNFLCDSFIGFSIFQLRVLIFMLRSLIIKMTLSISKMRLLICKMRFLIAQMRPLISKICRFELEHDSLLSKICPFDFKK